MAEKMTNICDVCINNKKKIKKEMAIGKCFLCGVDVCRQHSLTADIQFLGIYLDNNCNLRLCEKCNDQINDLDDNCDDKSEYGDYDEDVIKPLMEQIELSGLKSTLKKILTLHALKGKKKEDEE